MAPKRRKGTLPVSFHTLLQTLYITTRLYGQNGLAVVGQACAFGLMFSLFPIIFLVLSLALHLVNGYTPVVENLYSYVEQFLSQEQFTGLVSAVMSVKTIGLAEVIAGIGIFWFARRLFFNMMSGYNKIFKTRKARNVWTSSLWGMLLEALFIILCTVILVALVMIRSITGVLDVTKLFPDVLTFMDSWFRPLVTSYLPRSLLFLVIMFSYRYSPGTKPSYKLCAWTSFCTVIAFWGFQILFTVFTNLSRYNLVYGVVANVIVFLLEMVTFFYIYFFMAQYIFVYQFFNELLLAELYLLPSAEEKKGMASVRRWLFYHDAWLTTTEHTVEVSARQEIYVNGQEDNGSLYYVARGEVIIESSNGYYVEQGKGTFFGEVSAILERPREMTVIAKTDVTLVRIDRTMFVKILESDNLVTRKLLSKMSRAFDNV